MNTALTLTRSSSTTTQQAGTSWFSFFRCNFRRFFANSRHNSPRIPSGTLIVADRSSTARIRQKTRVVGTPETKHGRTWTQNKWNDGGGVDWRWAGCLSRRGTGRGLGGKSNAQFPHHGRAEIHIFRRFCRCCAIFFGRWWVRDNLFNNSIDYPNQTWKRWECYVCK